ncbi:hypothetical protein AWZ03_004801 [Drosophila navojoa]|uniref:Uncharacterized protein n=1 Tax=Drosophila navojoa TaxID=7232 RepID=A0A484BIQ5_DRONA|nr:hypothetical protein AWZ03_004801 [Drosophila navojoa]
MTLRLLCQVRTELELEQEQEHELEQELVGHLARAMDNGAHGNFMDMWQPHAPAQVSSCLTVRNYSHLTEASTG